MTTWEGWPVSGGADGIRIVIDETSFDFHGLSSGQLDDFLGDFNDALYDLQHDEMRVWKPPMFAETRCLEGENLYSYILDAVDRDIMLRFFSLADKCPEWEPDYPRCDEVEVDGDASRSAWSAAFAATAIKSGHGVACLAFPANQHRGFRTVNCSLGQCQIFFFSLASEMRDFWRGLYELEDIAEQDFFQLARRAFPGLIFHPDLTFRRFQGSYRERRDQVVQHLGELSDHFLEEYTASAAAGRVSDIESYFGSRGIGGVSRESVKTRGNARAMREREVELRGEQFTCEWHTKLRPDIDRIHFAFGRSLGEKILIGIFVDHLTT
jgi:hypothetical protein